MTTQLIGWPSADGRGRFEMIGQSELPSIMFIRHTMDTVGDITGAGTGAGKLKYARAVGLGKDADATRAQREAELTERSAWVAELLTGEHALGRALMLLAGGREFLAGTGVRLQGNGMAPRAARYIKDRRGRTPSDTSLDDAAAAAVAVLVFQVSVWEYVLGLEELPAARIAQDACLRSHLAGCAWRAAFRSLDGDESTGTTGAHSDRAFESVSLALEAGQLAAQAESLKAWARGERILEETAHTTARRALCSWVWRSLVPERSPGANAARARDCARKRARFLIRLIHGATWADAARLAGFADGAAASHSLAREHTWATLARAQAADAGQHPIATVLRRRWWQAARAEVRARRSARVWLRTTAPRVRSRKLALGLPIPGAVLIRHSGARRIARTTAGRIATFIDGPDTVEFAKDRAPKVSRKVRALAVNFPAAARQAIDKREQAARVTSGARARLVAFHARASHDWQLASKGLRKGFLR